MNKVKELWANKLIKTMVITLVVIIIIIIGVSIFFAIRGIRVKSYSALEQKVLNASIKYYTYDKSQLPANDGDESSVDTATLVNKKYLKEMENISPKGSTCSGQVYVRKVAGSYNYFVNLDCGEKYKTKTFSEKVKELNPIVTTSNGLYQVGDKLVFRGDNVNNYVKFNNDTYRIVNIDNDGYIKIIEAFTNKNIKSAKWDDRYNIAEDKYRGINEFYKSRINDTLLNHFNNSKIVFPAIKNNLTYQTVCDAKIDDAYDIAYDAECTDKTDVSLYSMLTVSNYMEASTDQNCVKIGDISCVNYNYLTNFQNNWWLLTATNLNTYNVYSVIGGRLMFSSANSTLYPRMVFRLDNRVPYTSGTGTYNDPFIIK